MTASTRTRNIARIITGDESGHLVDLIPGTTLATSDRYTCWSGNESLPSGVLIMFKVIGDESTDSGRAAGARVREGGRYIEETSDNITARLNLVSTRR